MINYSNLPEDQIRARILEDYSNGEDMDEIARRSGYHVNSCYRVIRRFKGKRSTKRQKGAGRSRILIQSVKIAISNCIRTKPWLGAAQIKKQLHLKIQPRTVRQYLNSLHYTYKRPYRKPFLSKQDKLNRVEWALKHKNYDFSNVVFADECSIWMTEWRGRMWVKKGSQHYIGTKAYDPKVHVWGAIGKDGVIGIQVFQGNLDAPRFIAILKESLIPEANARYGQGHWSLAQDNDPKHRASKTQNFLKSEKVALN